MQIKENESLANHSTFKIGGPAKFFIEVNNIEEIKEAIDFAKSKSLPFFVLGGGSNILFNDTGYEGVIIKIINSSFTLLDSGCVASAGMSFGMLINKTAEAGLSGLGWGVGIPGTIGGGVASNCGAYGSSMANNVESVTVLTEEGSAGWRIKKYSAEECGFDYRTSKFKNNPPAGRNKEIILEVEFWLVKEGSGITKERIKEVLKTRVGKIPPYPSAGCIFKNMILDDLPNKEELIKIIPPEKIKGGKLPAGYLIGACGLKGKKIGGGLITEQHANFIVNAGGAKSADIMELINLCKTKVKEKFGVDLEVEKVML